MTEPSHLVITIPGIELVSETSAEESLAAEGAAPDLVAGIQVAYTKPAPTQVSFYDHTRH